MFTTLTSVKDSALSVKDNTVVLVFEKYENNSRNACIGTQFCYFDFAFNKNFAPVDENLQQISFMK